MKKIIKSVSEFFREKHHWCA